MAKNDIMLIDSLVCDRAKGAVLSDTQRGEVFEKLATEQILKEFDLSSDEISKGIVDGKDDGGIDSFYIFVNGNLLQDASNFVWPRSSCEIMIYIITCKHYDTYRQDVLNSEYTSISELFDMSVSDDKLIGNYNADILEHRDLFKKAYQKTASSAPEINFRYFFASRGNTDEIGENIVSRARQIEAKTIELFSKCRCKYEFLGSTELLALYRKRPEYNLELPYVSQIEHQGGHIVLARLSDYYKFITDEDGHLRKYLFDSNVRDYMGQNPVNEDIMNSLKSQSHADFWWLNNGITILATSAVSTDGILTIGNVQIVNGLQTSQSIFNYFSNKNSLSADNRIVMVKIIKQTDESVRDAIIRSTNNQTAIAVTSLFATDDVQRNIEEIMKQKNLYYERRLNYYLNQGVDREYIFDIMYLAAGYIALVYKEPEYASRLKRKLLTKSEKYDLIFNTQTSLLIWPQISIVLRKVDKRLSDLLNRAADFSYSNNRLKKTRYIVSILVLTRVFKNFNFTVTDLLERDVNQVTNQMINDTWQFVSKYYANEFMTKRWYLNMIYDEASKEWGIDTGLAAIKNKHNTISTENENSKRKQQCSTKAQSKVLSALPPLPWNQSISKVVALTVGLSTGTVVKAIRNLVENGQIVSSQKEDSHIVRLF